MSFGGIFYNDSNQILISDAFKNLHFIRKLTSVYDTVRSTTYGGGSYIWEYRTNLDNGVKPIPFFDLSSSDFRGITAIRDLSGGDWEIEVIGSGSTAPNLYIFSEARGAPDTQQYGMIVKTSSGETTFDSRKNPLAVVAGVNANPPSDPLNGFDYTLAAKFAGSAGSNAESITFTPDNESLTNVSTPANSIAFYPSLAQAHKQQTSRVDEEECDGFDKLNICISKRYYVWISGYWAFYRAGIRRHSATQLAVGWIPVANGSWQYEASQGGVQFGPINITFDSDSNEQGLWPYSNETINLVNSTGIIADRANYA